MKGYSIESGYMGYVNGSYMLFASEADYIEYMSEQSCPENSLKERII